MKRILAVLLVVMSMGLSLFGCGSNKSDWEYIQERNKIIVGFDYHFPPMGYQETGKGCAGSQYVGFDIDVAKAMGEAIGVEIKLVPITWSSKETELSSKKIDLIWNGYTITEDRKKVVDFSIPYLKNTQTVVVRTDSTLKTVEDIAAESVRISCQQKSSAEDAITGNELLKNKKIASYPTDNANAMQELASNKVDAVVIDKVVADYYAANGDFKGKIKILDINLMDEEYGIGLRKGDVNFTQKVNEALVALKKSGKLGEIATKYFGSPDTLVPDSL